MNFARLRLAARGLATAYSKTTNRFSAVTSTTRSTTLPSGMRARKRGAGEQRDLAIGGQSTPSTDVRPGRRSPDGDGAGGGAAGGAGASTRAGGATEPAPAQSPPPGAATRGRGEQEAHADTDAEGADQQRGGEDRPRAGAASMRYWPVACRPRPAHGRRETLSGAAEAANSGARLTEIDGARSLVAALGVALRRFAAQHRRGDAVDTARNPGGLPRMPAPYASKRGIDGSAPGRGAASRTRVSSSLIGSTRRTTWTFARSPRASGRAGPSAAAASRRRAPEEAATRSPSLRAVGSGMALASSIISSSPEPRENSSLAVWIRSPIVSLDCEKPSSERLQAQSSSSGRAAYGR
jgi:hypothetical protein